MKSLMILVALFSGVISAHANALNGTSAQMIARAAAQRSVNNDLDTARANIDAIFAQKLEGKIARDQLNVEAISLRNSLVNCKQIRGADACKAALINTVDALEQKLKDGRLKEQSGYTLIDMIKFAQDSVFEGNGVER